MKYFLITLLISISITSTKLAIAGDEVDKIYLNHVNNCRVTKPAENDYEPSKFQPTNNLLRSSGVIPQYCGQKIVIKGTVLDQNCVPVSDAKVYLWQVGCDGKYPYKPLRTRVDKKLLNLLNNSTFQGSGTATTNNMGQFYFVTILPSVIHDSNSPYVNIRVKSRDLGDLETKLHFSNNKLNTNDEDIDAVLSNVSEETPIYNFEIVMPGEVLKSY